MATYDIISTSFLIKLLNRASRENRRAFTDKHGLYKRLIFWYIPNPDKITVGQVAHYFCGEIGEFWDEYFTVRFVENLFKRSWLVVYGATYDLLHNIQKPHPAIDALEEY